jgi:alkylhydroperoxidase AhpD family core domain
LLKENNSGDDPMLDWNEYRSEVMQRVGDLGKLTPETLKGVMALGNAGNKTNLLGAKVRELIALACAVTTRCDGCIAVHAEAAVKAGATEEEIAEALGVAINLNAGAAVVYSARTLDAIKQLKAQ